MTLPDVTALLVAYLAPILAPVPVSSRVPNPRPASFMQVRRVGGTTSVVADRPRFDVFAWAATDPAAMTLALTVRQALWLLPGTTLLGAATYQITEFLGPRFDDDETTGTPRVWATYELSVRADDLIQPAASIVD